MRISPNKLFIPLLLCGALPACDRGSSPGAVFGASSGPAVAASQAGPVGPVAAPLPEKVTFNEHVQPILSEYCYHCHGPDSGTRLPKNEPLRLDLAADAHAARASGEAVIIPGDPAASLLVRRLHSADPDEVMPPPKSHKTLSEREIALLERWVEQGGEYQAHWSFIPPTKPAIPNAGTGWARNPIDHFIAARLEAEKLSPNPEEEPRRFFRRLHFDLTGLPPSPAAVEAFATAAATDYQRAVEAAADQLLASTGAAEHQARIWLDAARYADTHGIHIDNYRAIWPYRDWVIRAFQENMPWDRFTIEQLAGDLLPQPTLDQTVATGFNRCLPTTGEGGAIAEEYEAIYAKDRVDTVSAVWLGLTTGCASCHDHKFDAISTRDFYSFAAFFRNTTMAAMDGNKAEHPPNVFVPPAADRARWEGLPKELSDLQASLKTRASEARADFEKWLASATPAAIADLSSGLSQHLPLNEADGPLDGTAAAERTPQQVELLYQHYLASVDGPARDLQAKLDAATKEQAAIRARGSVTLVMQERPDGEPMAHVLARGVYTAKGEKVSANVPAALPPLPEKAPHNRLGLARWLVSRVNPLPARVTVNRFWQQCFGTGIVETTEDFGVMGTRPSHPQLLDWLASEFMDANWNSHHVLKLIVTSASYRQAAEIAPEKLERDPYNRLLARGPRNRLDAEAIRDLALSASGLLASEVGGPSVKPYQPEGIWSAVAMKESNTRNYQPDSGSGLYRRSLYTFWKRTAPPPSMEILNAPVREVTCVRRERTNTPLQSLVMLNDPQFVEASRQLAAAAIKAGGDQTRRLDFITARLLSRPLTPDERGIIVRSLAEALATFTAKPEDAKALVAIGATPPDAAIPAPELAAWTLTASQILNLDETLTH